MVYDKTTNKDLAEITILEGPYIDVGGKKGFVKIERSKTQELEPPVRSLRYTFVRRKLKVNL